MPKGTINYNETIIYKIQHNDNPELFYVGHTTKFSKMKSRINTLMKTPPPTTGKYRQLYEMILNNGGFNEFNFIEVKKYGCNDANEADAEKFKIIADIKNKLDDEKTRKERHITPLKYKYGNNVVIMCPM